MKKAMGFVTGVTAAALAGAGFYLMMNEDTKKKACKTIHQAAQDAGNVVNKTMNNMKK